MQEVSDILATLHDGGIEGFKGDYFELELEIGCTYLAEIEKVGYEYFYFTITDVTRFEFHYWDGKLVSGLEDIIDMELEIGYSKVEDGIVKTSCNVWTKEAGHSGGELWIEANYSSLKNHAMQPIQPETLYEMSSTYWNRTKK
jgi:hypothetical protein